MVIVEQINNKEKPMVSSTVKAWLIFVWGEEGQLVLIPLCSLSYSGSGHGFFSVNVPNMKINITH